MKLFVAKFFYTEFFYDKGTNRWEYWFDPSPHLRRLVLRIVLVLLDTSVLKGPELVYNSYYWDTVAYYSISALTLDTLKAVPTNAI